MHLSPDGHVERFIYNDETARFELVRLIARLDLPLNTGEQSAWGEYIRNSFYPSYRLVSRQSTTRDMKKFYSLRQFAVIDLLNQATCVCLTSDIWNGNFKEDYLSVVFHFVTSDWELDKRIVGLN